MQSWRGIGTGCIASMLACALWQCGGKTGTETSAGGSGGTVATDCVGGADAGGCGQGGADDSESGLEPYARLRTASCLHVKVNRRGAAVCLDYHIR